MSTVASRIDNEHLPLTLPAARRRRAFERFFLRHPGSGRTGLGLGRAVVDFLDWEIASGRLHPTNGPPWWRMVSGRFAADLRDALALADGSVPDASPACLAWLAYAAAGPQDAQAALWDAHELTLQAGVEDAGRYLDSEAAAERAFVGIVLRAVRQAASSRTETDTSYLAELTGRLYPKLYPISDGEVAALQATLQVGRARPG